MTIKKIYFLIVTVLYILGCHKDEDNNLNLLSIDLITNDNPTVFAKTVILFENDDYLIKTNLEMYINAYPFDILFGYDELKEQVTQDSNNQDVLMMTDYLYLPKDSTYILAYHLEHGSCLIFNKKTNEIITSIEMEEYTEGEPMQSTRGRRFYINGDLFLETVDMIS